jgi:hypothetical protein
MPLARYFVFVGGVLLTLLFISDAYLPKLPVADSDYAGVDRSIIRIHSDRKWPERIVFDTSRPTEVSPQIASVAASAAAPKTAADVSTTVRTREAFAQLPLDPKQAQLSAAAKSERSAALKPEPKLQPKRKIAKRRAAPPMVLVAQQPQFGFFANNTW